MLCKKLRSSTGDNEWALPYSELSEMEVVEFRLAELIAQF